MMKQRPLGNSGIMASAIGLGSHPLSGWVWGSVEPGESVRTIQAALDMGMSLIDTAPIYGLGLSEIIVGRAIKDRRDKAVISTKCGIVCDASRGEFLYRAHGQGLDPDGHLTVHAYLGSESIRKEIEASLTRLQTDTIDLYQTHWQPATTPLAEVMETLLGLKAQGKIRAIGVSNAAARHMEQYCAVAPLDSAQEVYSMLNRGIEGEQLPFCRDRGMAVLAYAPLAQGLLTGKCGPDRVFGPGDRRTTSEAFSVENRRRVTAMLERIEPVAREHGVTLAQLAIAWAIREGGATHALCGARNAAQVAENARAGEVSLTADEIQQINQAIEAYQAGQ
jgi:aryl-alcohol dehydrogenase-like predicted oxidoreductase